MTNIFKFPHARRKDPSTSQAAAGKVDVSAQAWKVLQAYKNGEMLLDHEAYKRVGLAEENQKRFAHQRCSDLRRAGLIEPTGDRGITPSGNTGNLCRITMEGRYFIGSGGKSTLPPTQGAKMPVDISKRVAQYVQLRDLIKVKETELKKTLAPYKKALEDLNAVLLNHLNGIGGNSLNTDAGTVYKTEKKSASLADPAAFMSYVIDNAAFDLLDRKANVTAVTEFMKQNKGAPPPGVNFSSAFVVGVRRPGQDKQENNDD